MLICDSDVKMNNAIGITWKKFKSIRHYEKNHNLTWTYGKDVHRRDISWTVTIAWDPRNYDIYNILLLF